MTGVLQRYKLNGEETPFKQERGMTSKRERRAYRMRVQGQF